MATCPNKNHPDWEKLVNLVGEEKAYFLWDKYNGEIPKSEYPSIKNLSPAQKKFQEKIIATGKVVKKVESKEPVDPYFMDTEEANNWYEVLLPNGKWDRVKKRVTDRVKAWYRQRFPGKTFTKEEKIQNEIKRTFGIKGHKFFENIHNRYFDETGVRRTQVLERPTFENSFDESVYTKLENYYTGLINKFSEGGKSPLVFSEVIVYDSLNREAGTIDLLIVDEAGKANIFDWKFLTVGEGSEDIAWFKQGAYNIQLGTYKDILIRNYGVKEIGMNRAIPIIMNLKKTDEKVKGSPQYVSGIVVGSFDTSKIEDLRLAPVSEETESTGNIKLDNAIKELSAAYKQIAKEEVSDEEQRSSKKDRLNAIRRAIRYAQSMNNIAPLIEVIQTMRNRGQQLVNEYETIYKNKPFDSDEFTDEQISEYAEDLREFKAMADIFGQMDVLVGELVYSPSMESEATSAEDKEDLAYRKKVLQQIKDEAFIIRETKKNIDLLSGEFADRFIGKRNNVTGILSPNVVLKGLGKLFLGTSEIELPSIRILHRMISNAKSIAARVATTEVRHLMDIRERLKKRGNLRDIVRQIYQKDDKGNLTNKLIYRFDKEFYTKVDKNAAEDKRDKKWLTDNIDIDAYKKEAKEVLDRRIERIKNSYTDDELIDRLIKQEKQKYDITRDDFTGYNNYIIKRHPLLKWESKEYIELKKDKDLMDLYVFITEINNKAKEIGYLENQVASSVFLPFVRKSMAESLTWDMDVSAIMKWTSDLKMREGDVGYGEYNSITGELENSIPKYYTYDFTKEKDDYSDVSEDLFKNLILYISHMEKYKTYSDIEGQLLFVKDIEKFKGHIAKSSSGDIITEGGKPKVEKGNEENTKMFDIFMRAMLYEQKYPLSDEDIPLGFGKALRFVKDAVNGIVGKKVFKDTEEPTATSLHKTIDLINRVMQLKTLGLEVISGSVNAFGGNIQIATQAGNYFKAKDVIKNEGILLFNNFRSDNEREMFLQLIDIFLPLQNDPAYEELKKAGMTALTRGSFSDFLMMFMKKPEELLEKSVFLSLLQNTMIVDGKIVSIPEYVRSKYKDRYLTAGLYKQQKQSIEKEIEELKRTKSIDSTKKLVDGKLVIPGLDLTNVKELQRLTSLTRRLSSNATGNFSDVDVNNSRLNIWTKSMMIFKNWIPKLIQTRFGKFRRVADDFSVVIDEDGLTEGEKYDIGRIRLFFQVIGESIRDRSMNITNILSANEKGIEKLDAMFLDFAEKYKKRTGEDLNLSREEFFDLIRSNLYNQVKETAMLLSLIGISIAIHLMAPDDDDDRAQKNFFRYSQRVIDKFISELSFYYSPGNFQQILSGSIFPALGLINDVKKFIEHFTMEVTGFDISNPNLTQEEVQKKAQPVKNLAKIFPVTKSLIIYGALIDPDFASEYDITIQRQSSNR